MSKKSNKSSFFLKFQVCASNRILFVSKFFHNKKIAPHPPGLRRDPTLVPRFQQCPDDHPEEEEEGGGGFS